MSFSELTFNPAEPFHANETLSDVLNRRFVAGFVGKGTFPILRDFTSPAVYDVFPIAGETYPQYIFDLRETTGTLYMRRSPSATEVEMPEYVVVDYHGNILEHNENTEFVIGSGGLRAIGIARRDYAGELTVIKYIFSYNANFGTAQEHA